MNTNKGIPLAVVIAQAIRKERSLIDNDLTGLTGRVTDLEQSVGELETKESDDEFVLPVGTPVNAVAASSVLTVADTPEEGDTVTVGLKTYRVRLDALGVGVNASCLLSLNSNPLEGDTFTVGAKTYTITRQALDENSPANTIYVDGLGTSSTIDNFLIAINTGYSLGKVSLGTKPNTLVAATKTSTSSMTVTAAEIGFAGNEIVVGEAFDDAASVWFEGATALSGGIDPEEANDVYCTTAETFIDNLTAAINDNGVPGTEYGTLTEVNMDCTAIKLTAATMKVTSRTLGVIGNDIAIAEDGTDLSWADDATELSGGIDGTPGLLGQTFYEDGDLWICNKEDLTVENNNWLSTTLT